MDFVIENGVLVKYTGTDKNVVIPDGVTSIGNMGFMLHNTLQSIIVPDSVTHIGSYAFSECSSLQSVTIPDSVTSIGNGAFCGCDGLADPSGLIVVRGVLYGCKRNQRDATIPDGVTVIGDSAFEDCHNLQSVIIPDSVTSIGEEAFYNCRGLQNVTLSNSITCIKNMTFCGCRSLQSIVIPDGVTKIGDEAFSGCRRLQSIAIPESVAHIGTGAFENCTSLQNVTILNEAVKIEGHAFWNCPRLVNQGGFAIVKGTLCSCTAEKKNVRIPDGVTHIGWDALRGCGDYQTLSMPKALFGEASRGTLRGTNAGLILREEGHTSFMAYSQYSCGYGGNDGDDNLHAFVKQNNWQEYDQELINNGPVFKYRVPTRFLGMLGRLQDPVQLSESAKEAFLEYLVKNVKKLVELAEETCCPDMITAAAQCGVINDTNAKAIQKLIDKSQVPEIAALANLEIRSAAAAERSLREPADPLAAAYVDKLKAMDANKLLKGMKLAGVKLPEVKLKDGAPAPEEVFRFILVSYGNSYNEREQGFVRKRQADAAAKLLDSRSFADAVAYIYDHYCGPLYPKTIPMVCRYGDSAQIRKLLDDAKQWNEWSVYGQSGRTAWYSLSDALALSDTREAVVWLLENTNLWGFVRVHGGTIEEVCNRYVFDFGFDAHGIICFDLNAVKVEAKLDDEMKLALTRTDTGKIVKSLPKKDVDPDVWEENSKLSALRKNLKKAKQLKTSQLLEAYLDKTAWKAKEWAKSYLKNVFLNKFAGLLVWSQDGNTFTVSGKDIVRSDGSAYKLTDQNILVAHPMEMKQEDVLAWQEYFRLRGIKQPFDQVWEPVYDRKTVRPDRYQGCRIFYRYAQNAEKHGIHYFESFHQGTAEFVIRDCALENQLENSLRHGISADATFKLGEFTFKKYTRQVNHIVFLFDKWTIRTRIRNDDTSVLQMLGCYNVAQITDFLNTAIESKAANLTTALLAYKQEHYPDYDAFNEFTLE